MNRFYQLLKQDLQNEVQVVDTGCQGFCERGPILIVQPGDIFYEMLEEKDIPHLVEEHFLKGRPVEEQSGEQPTVWSAVPALVKYGPAACMMMTP